MLPLFKTHYSGNGRSIIQINDKTKDEEISKIPNTQFEVWFLRFAVSDDKSLEVWVDAGFEILYKRTFEPLNEDTDVFADGTYDDAVVFRVQANRAGKDEDSQNLRVAVEERLGRLLSNLTKSDEMTTEMQVTVERNPFLNIIRNYGSRFTGGWTRSL